MDALVFSPPANIYVARDARDVMWSLYHANANAKFYELIYDTAGRVGPPLDPPPADIRQYWRDGFGATASPSGRRENMRSWWAIRDLPNVLFVHYN